MRLVVTGGGTGGHIYPALEVARRCAELSAEISYFGSHRGQEGPICRTAGIDFHGFASEPLWSLRTPRGWRAAYRLLRASSAAKALLRKLGTEVVFSTGGYSAAPIMRAAASLGLPFVIHEQNSVPGRSNLMFAPKARAVATTFRSSVKHFRGVDVIRTGMPIRQSLREAAVTLPANRRGVIVLGGSQGSKFLNELVPKAAARLVSQALNWTHSSGPAHQQVVLALAAGLDLGPTYRVAPYLNSEDLIGAYKGASVAVARSGGTLAELAMFRLPSVLIPLPTSAGNHQHHNAIEFSDMGAATVLSEDQVTEALLAEAVLAWVEDSSRQALAANALAEWDVPDSTDQVAALVMGAKS